MIGKLQRNPTTGKLQRNPVTGKLIRFSAEGQPCCCEDGGGGPVPTPCSCILNGPSPTQIPCCFDVFPSGISVCSGCFVTTQNSSFSVTGNPNAAGRITRPIPPLPQPTHCDHTATDNHLTVTAYNSLNCGGPPAGTSVGRFMQTHSSLQADLTHLYFYMRAAAANIWLFVGRVPRPTTLTSPITFPVNLLDTEIDPNTNAPACGRSSCCFAALGFILFDFNNYIVAHGGSVTIVPADCARPIGSPPGVTGGGTPLSGDAMLDAMGYNPDTSPDSPKFGSCCDPPK